MKRFSAIFALAVLTVVLTPGAGLSADKNPTVADAAIDLAVPDSPALTALGLGPNSVERPGSPRELAASMLYGVDANGNVQTGIAIDVAPYLWYSGEETALREYQERYFLRFLSRTALSFGAAKGLSDKDKEARFAVGVRFTPWDEGDPRMDEGFAECLRDAVLDVEINIQKKLEAVMEERDAALKQKALVEMKIREAKMQEAGEKVEVLEEILYDTYRKIDSLNKQREELLTMNFAELNARSTSAITDCRKNKVYRTDLWNRSSWSFGVAPTFTSTTGAEDDLKSSGTAWWTSIAFNLWDRGQLVLHTRYRNNEEAPDPAGRGRYVRQDSFRAGGRVRFGGPDLNFTIEGVHVTENRKGNRGEDKKIQYSAGLEHKIADDLWLVLTVGSEAYDDKEDNLIVLGNLRWAQSPGPVKKF